MGAKNPVSRGPSPFPGIFQESRSRRSDNHEVNLERVIQFRAAAIISGRISGSARSIGPQLPRRTCRAPDEERHRPGANFLPDPRATERRRWQRPRAYLQYECFQEETLPIPRRQWWWRRLEDSRPSLRRSLTACRCQSESARSKLSPTKDRAACRAPFQSHESKDPPLPARESMLQVFFRQSLRNIVEHACESGAAPRSRTTKCRRYSASSPSSRQTANPIRCLLVPLKDASLQKKNSRDAQSILHRLRWEWEKRSGRRRVRAVAPHRHRRPRPHAKLAGKSRTQMPACVGFAREKMRAARDRRRAPRGVA